MKKFFTFSILFLLSIVTTASFASGKTDPSAKLKSSTVDGLTDPEFSDGDKEVWYYIRFGRRAAENLVWSLDYPASWAIKQSTQKETDKYTQHWKLVGDLGSFYIENRATGYKVTYATAADPEKGIRGGNYIVDADGGPGVDLKLAGSRDNEDATYWNWTGALDWVIINPSLSAHAFMNDRASNTAFPWRDVCHYAYADDGFRIQFVYAEKQTIVVATDSLAIESLVGHTSQKVLNGIDNFNLSGGITATIEGDDASSFGFLDGANTVPTGKGSLTVTFTPQAERTYNATVVLSGGTAEPVRVRLTGTGFSSGSLPQISSEDASNEHWYYIQFYRKAAAGIVWSLSDTTQMIVQDTLRAADIKAEQQWKICGSWEEGYYLVNKAGNIEITYNVTASEDGTKPASRYIQASYGDSFDFVRFSVSGVATGDWQLYNRSTTATSKYVNDQAGSFLTSYSLNDAGCRLVFIPADKPVVTASVSSLALEIPANNSLESTITVTGLQTTAAISAAISGVDAAAFSVSPASLPAEGGKLTITFSPAAVKSYTATLTLSSAGADNTVIALTGNSDLGLPTISTTGNEVWYYIQFTRKTTMAWTALPEETGRYGTRVKQTLTEDGNTDQHWKLEGSWTEGYRIINRNGGVLNFIDESNPDTDPLHPNLNFYELEEEEAFGDLHLFKRQSATAKWQLQNKSKRYGIDEDEADRTYMNDDNGAAGDGSISLYLANDGGNTLNFIAVDPVNSIPSVNDVNGEVVAVKYYTLTGQEVARPTVTGVYIVKNIFASGKAKASKQLFIK
jgi:hypothetical protein